MQQEKNQLRLGVQIKSLKNHQFTAQLYISHKSIPELGIKNFRTTPTQAIVNAKAEVQLNNTFRCYLFEANRAELKQKFSRSINIQIWHNDRIKKDILLGIAKLNLQEVLAQPFRKSKESYAVVYDVYLPIDQVDEEENPIKKIGALRIIVYLEDLGPVSRLKQKGFDIKNFIEEYEVPQGQQPNLDNPPLPSENHKELNEGQRLELNDLEHKVVWELQVWKKSQENRTRLILKQKEAQFWANLSEQQKKSDLQKQKQFKKIEAALLLHENKLKAKMNELIKREQKIIVYEQELQSKINEVSREIFLKDGEIDRLKKRQKQEKTVLIKQKSTLELEISKLRAENARLKVEVEEERGKREDESTPLNKLKSELEHKRMEIKNLHNELEKCMQVKQQYKIHFQKMRDEVILQKSLVKEKQEQLITSNSELMILKNNIKHLEQKIKIIERQNYQQQQQFYQDQNYDEYDDGPVFSSQREKLMQERRNLIEMNGYSPDDPLIQQYDRKIAALN